ncbi:unnamed protein product, partial [marine sediment metagenome]
NIVANIPVEIARFGMERAGRVGPIPSNLILLFWGFWFIAFVVQMYLTAGHHIFMLRMVRGEPYQIGDLFSGGRFVVRMLGNNLVMFILVGLGMMACIVPGVIVLLMFWPFVYVLVDTDARGLEPLSRAKDITSGNWGAVFLLFLAFVGIQFAGAIACLVPLLLTTPFVVLLFAVAYCEMTGQRVASNENRA